MVDKRMLLEFELYPCGSPKERAIHSNQENQIKFPQGVEPCKSSKIAKEKLEMTFLGDETA